eukprot:GHVQ01013821.1.p1 GENE.GHVQ01013821.1~~GHVQ01013821.1.p1  ORF type:complete len:122 (-),score=26.56 GHVQ01013821.1:616-981(-)
MVTSTYTYMSSALSVRTQPIPIQLLKYMWICMADMPQQRLREGPYTEVVIVLARQQRGQLGSEPTQTQHTHKHTHTHTHTHKHARQHQPYTWLVGVVSCLMRPLMPTIHTHTYIHTQCTTH